MSSMRHLQQAAPFLIVSCCDKELPGALNLSSFKMAAYMLSYNQIIVFIEPLMMNQIFQDELISLDISSV